MTHHDFGNSLTLSLVPPGASHWWFERNNSYWMSYVHEIWSKHSGPPGLCDEIRLNPMAFPSASAVGCIKC